MEAEKVLFLVRLVCVHYLVQNWVVFEELFQPLVGRNDFFLGHQKKQNRPRKNSVGYAVTWYICLKDVVDQLNFFRTSDSHPINEVELLTSSNSFQHTEWPIVRIPNHIPVNGGQFLKVKQVGQTTILIKSV